MWQTVAEHRKNEDKKVAEVRNTRKMNRNLKNEKERERDMLQIEIIADMKEDEYQRIASHRVTRNFLIY